MASLTKEEQRDYKKEADMASMVKKKVKEFDSFISDWRKEATVCYDMVAGKQWTDADKTKLEAEDRVAVVFNRIAAFVRGVCGMEASNRQSVKYLPREMGDVQPNEIMNSAASWVRDECRAEDEESEAFRDMVITGIGCTETRLDYETDPEGMIFVERRDPLRVGYDPTAVKRNLVDANWCFSFADYSKASFEAKWPEKSDEVFTSIWPDEHSNSMDNADTEAFYKDDDAHAQPKNAIRVVQFQYFKTVKVYRIQDPTGQTQEIPADRFAKMKKLFDQQGVKYVPISKREYRQCFVAGDVALEDIPLPADEFTLKFLTGIRDRNKGCFYGMVRDAIDPQRWSNKFFSLAIDILATNPKGGLMAETDAFEDKTAAEENWADPRSIVWMRPGGIGKIQTRNPNAPPPALDSMMGFAVNSMPQIMGINMEFLGLADRAQAGVLESQRKQAAITTLAEFFSALSLYRKVQGKCLMTMINRYLSDGRLIRIVGNENSQYVPLTKQPGFEKFDVVVDEAPNAPDVKSRTWEVLQNLLPQMMKMGIPIPPELLDYTPLPASLSAKWKQLLVQAKQQPQLSPEHQKQMEQMQQELQRLSQENQQLKSNTQLKMQELELKRQETIEKLALQKEENDMQIQLKREMAILDAQIEQEKMEQDSAMKKFEHMTNNPELYERLQQESKTEELMGRVEGVTDMINGLMQTVNMLANEVSKEVPPEAEPKSIQLVYDAEKTLKEAVMTKDDGTVVKVKVGRKGK